MKIGVYGSAYGSLSKELIEKAREIGREIARQKQILITGACLGLPNEAVIGASELKGSVIGYSPAVDLKSHAEKDNYPTKGYTKFVFIPKDYIHRDNPTICRKYRNVSSVSECDAAIFISGRSGTLNEFTIAYDLNKIIGVLKDSRGISDVIPLLLKTFDNKVDVKIVFEKEPVKLVRKIISAFNSKALNKNYVS